jgi:NAD(P)-dependent dehydrogenase (short-subunit alcohol dehydrogenase family)
MPRRHTMTVTLVTGTSTGLGQATALELSRKGHHVFASMRNPGAGAPLLEAQDAEGLKLDVIQLDVDDQKSIDECVSEIEKQAGTIDVLVNNAGILQGVSVEETPMETLRGVMETNFFGAIAMMQRVLPRMREQRSGAVVNVTSVSGRLAVSPMFTYQASKWALESATETLAMEVTRFGIRVVLIEPGVIYTPMVEKLPVPEPTSPYAQFSRRMGRYFMERLKEPSMPDLVADAVYESITTDEPKLRYLVGPDAQKLIPRRLAISDEEWIAVGMEMSDEEFADRFEEIFDLTLATAEEAGVDALPEG